MNIGTQILKIRKEKGLTQEEFGKIFHVTRQTVSNWENEKSYPDLQILIDISNRFDISLDVLIKEDVKMVKTMDKERVLGSLKREKSVIDFFTGAGTGIVISCLFSADTMVRTVTIVLGVVMIGIGWDRGAKNDKYTKNPLTMVLGTFMIKLYLLSDICIIRYINYIEDNEER